MQYSTSLQTETTITVYFLLNSALLWVFFFFLLPLYFVLITITLHLNGVMQGTLLFLLDSGFSDLGTNWEHISLET